MNIIALTGKARTGKNYAAGLLEELLFAATERRPVVDGFAAPLRHAAQAVADYQGLRNFDVERGKHSSLLPGVSARAFMQAFGQACREVSEDCWCRALLDRIEYASAPDYLIITDLRYENETRWVHGLGGIVVQTLRQPSGPVGGILNHPSEQSLPLACIDYQLDNTGTDEATTEHWRIILRDRGWL